MHAWMQTCAAGAGSSSRDSITLRRDEFVRLSVSYHALMTECSTGAELKSPGGLGVESKAWAVQSQSSA